MCTSFMFRGQDTLIAMNYDNHGKNFELSPYQEDRFLVTLHSFGKKRPLFGIRNDGVMANQQVVNECADGRFRVGFHKVNTSDFVGKVICKPGKIKNMNHYLKSHEVVNPPKNSLHVLLVYPNQESYIIEPGRGVVIYSEKEPFVVMSNCPVTDFKSNGEWKGFGVDRQLKVEEELKKANSDFSVTDAFSVLEMVHQEDPIWNTEFSFVYSYNENKVYYCFDHRFHEVSEYQLKK